MLAKLRHLFIVCLLFLTIQSCTKEENLKDCEVNKYGWIRVSNNSSNPYDFYIDGEFNTTLSGKSISNAIKISEGNDHKLYVKQVSGYVLYPTEVSKLLTVIKCSEYAWQIP